MTDLEDVYRGTTNRWQAVLLGTLLLGGGFVAVVGFALAAASLVAGFGLSPSVALKIAVTLGGALLVVGYVGFFARTNASPDRWAVVAGGAIAAIAGLGLFWTALPAGWTGDFSAVPPAAVGAYAVGLLTVFGSVLAVKVADGAGASDEASGSACGSATRTKPIGGIESAVSSDTEQSSNPNIPSADGGTDESDLHFFEDDE